MARKRLGRLPPSWISEAQVSRPAEFHHRPLAEPDVNLSAHPAPIKQTRRRTACLSHASKSSCYQLPRSCDRLTRPLCSSPIKSLHRSYESVRPSAPHRYARLAVLAAWAFSLRIRATGSCSSTRQPASASRPLYAGRRPLSHQAPRGLVPGEPYAPGFDDS
jgi:hypothetical protein